MLLPFEGPTMGIQERVHRAMPSLCNGNIYNLRGRACFLRELGGSGSLPLATEQCP